MKLQIGEGLKIMCSRVKERVFWSQCHLLFPDDYSHQRLQRGGDPAPHRMPLANVFYTLDGGYA